MLSQTHKSRHVSRFIRTFATRFGRLQLKVDSSYRNFRSSLTMSAVQICTLTAFS